MFKILKLTTRSNLLKNKESEKINVNKDETKNPIKNKQNKTLSTKDEGTKKKSISWCR